MPALGQLARGEDSETKHPGPEEKKGGWLRYGGVARPGRIDSRGDVTAGILSLVEVFKSVEEQARLEMEVYRLVDIAADVEDGDEVAEQKVDLAVVIESVAEIEDVSTNNEVHIGEAAVCGAVAVPKRGRRIGDGERTGAVACVADDVVEDDVIGDRTGVSCDGSCREAQKENEGRKILTQWSSFPEKWDIIKIL